jgi:acyl-CoA synthetase (AMP-forming)/AMP-acid ligase II
VAASADDKFSLRYITSGGGKTPVTQLKKLHEMFPKAEFIVMYGLTESFRSSYLPY